jgi:hypothetical protein
MFSSAVLASAFAILAAATPIKRDTYYGVGVEFQLKFADGTPYYEPSPIEINQLTQINATGVYQISLDKTASNVDIDQVECRAYKDAAGVVPGSAPFTKANPALLSTTGVTVGSILCYITESS